MLDLREVMPAISSFKPHLNTHECHLNMIINNKINIPIKMYLHFYAEFFLGTIPRNDHLSSSPNGLDIPL